METQKIIITKNLTKKYRSQTAVNKLSLEINKGEIYGFLGPNGAGKTTTLLMLLGLCRPTEGSATIFGLDCTRKTMEIKQRVGFLSENMGFYEDLNSVQSLEYIASLNGLKTEGLADLIEKTLNEVGLSDIDEKKTGAFSRGMRQRLGIAEVLMKKPEVLFLDEPTLGLDPDGAQKLIELIRSLNQDKKITVILSSHNLYQVQKISHRVGIMIKGNMVAEGSIDELSQEKFGIETEQYSLEEIYMKYFQEV